MTPDLLASIGEALYGERWQTALARDLGVSDRRVRQWVAGDGKPRAGVWKDLQILIDERHRRLVHLATELYIAANTMRS